MENPNFPIPIVAVSSFRRAWWIIDPRDRYGCCHDCQRVAAQSPYDAPGSGGNELYQTPGDGHTSCGASCTCVIEYVPPHLLRWAPLSALSAHDRKLRSYPKDVIVRHEMEYGGLDDLPDIP